MSTLERYRNYLRMLASVETSERFQGKVDLSGVVQETMVDALREEARLQGLPEHCRVSWLRTTLANNLRDEIRKWTAEARDVGRERSIEAALNDSASRIEAWLEADHSSPSQRAERNESLLRLADALARLSEDQRRVVELHHLAGHPISETAAAMGRSKDAVGGLLFRGLKRLKELMDEPSHAT